MATMAADESVSAGMVLPDSFEASVTAGELTAAQHDILEADHLRAAETICTAAPAQLGKGDTCFTNGRHIYSSSMSADKSARYSARVSRQGTLRAA